MIITTSATSIDWVWADIDIADDRIDQFYNLIDTPELYQFYEQGVNEGWITIIGPVQ
jgi:hypothetical protein